MSESEWLACAEPISMLELLRRKGSERKLRLFALACCARIKRLITHPATQAALDFAEQHVETEHFRSRGREVAEWTVHEAYLEAQGKMDSCHTQVEQAKCLIISKALNAVARALNIDPWTAAAYASSFSCFALAYEAQVASGKESYSELKDSFKQPEQAKVLPRQGRFSSSSGFPA